VSLHDKPLRNAQVADSLDAPDAALPNYLDTLLSDIESQLTRPVPEVPKVEVPTADIPKQQPAKPDPIPAPASTQVHKGEAAEDTARQRHGSVIPVWGMEAFQALLFKVGGVLMGVPLTALGGILKGSDMINELPGQPAWLLGMLLDRRRKILVVDTARVLMPERAGSLLQKLRSGNGYILLVEGGHWGLAVDGIASTTWLEPHQVRWRTTKERRVWLAGVIVEQLSVLLDVDGMIELLAS